MRDVVNIKMRIVAKMDQLLFAIDPENWPYGLLQEKGKIEAVGLSVPSSK